MLSTQVYLCIVPNAYYFIVIAVSIVSSQKTVGARAQVSSSFPISLRRSNRLGNDSFVESISVFADSSLKPFKKTEN